MSKQAWSDQQNRLFFSVMRNLSDQRANEVLLEFCLDFLGHVDLRELDDICQTALSSPAELKKYIETTGGIDWRNIEGYSTVDLGVRRILFYAEAGAKQFHEVDGVMEVLDDAMEWMVDAGFSVDQTFDAFLRAVHAR